jgi:hypothetical protein
VTDKRRAKDGEKSEQGIVVSKLAGKAGKAVMASESTQRKKEVLDASFDSKGEELTRSLSVRKRRDVKKIRHRLERVMLVQQTQTLS